MGKSTSRKTKRRLVSLLITALCMSLIATFCLTGMFASATDPIEKKAASLSLDDQNLTLQCYVQINDETITQVKLGRDLGGAVIEDMVFLPLGTPVSGEVYNYVFSYNVPAKDVATPIILRAYNASEEQVGSSLTFTVQEYCNGIVNGGYNSKTKNLAKAILNYGSAAQTYFGKGTAFEAETDKAVSTEAFVSNALEGFPERALSGGDTFAYYGTSLLLKEKIVLRHYFTLQGGQNVPTGADAPTGSKTLDGQLYYYYDTKVSPLEIDCEEVLNKGGVEIEYSVSHYIYDTLNQESGTNLTKLLCALHDYGQAADDYVTTSYGVTLHPNDGIINEGNVTSYTYGTGATLPTSAQITKENYTFGGWYDNEGLTGEAVEEITATDFGVKEYWAKWTPKSYGVTLNENGGVYGDASDETKTYTYGTGATLPVDTQITKENYTFGGWYDNEGLTGEAVETITDEDSGDKQYWAKWTPKSYGVTLNENGGIYGVASDETKTYTYGTIATLPTGTQITKANYDFAGWYDNEGLTGTAVETITDEDFGVKEYWAKWTPKSYGVTLNENGGDYGDPEDETKTYTYGTITTLPTGAQITKENYTFGGWYDNEGLTGTAVETITDEDSGDKQYWAKWNIIPVNNITDLPTGGIVDAQLTLSGTVAPSNATYKDIVWSVDDAGDTGITIQDDAGRKYIQASNSGTATLRATIENGLGVGLDYTQTFDITCIIPVESISTTGTPRAAYVNEDVTLAGEVLPYAATNQTLDWSVAPNDIGAVVQEPVSTGAWTISATKPGTVTVTVKAENGKVENNRLTDYVEDSFDITFYEITDVPEIIVVGDRRSLNGATLAPNDGQSISWTINTMATNYNTANAEFTNTSQTTINAKQAGQVILTATIGTTGVTRDFKIEFLDITLNSTPEYANRNFDLVGTVTLNTTDVTNDYPIIWVMKNNGGTNLPTDGSPLSGTLCANAPCTIIVRATIIYNNGKLYSKNIDITLNYPQTISMGTLAQTKLELMKGDTDTITWSTPATISADASGSGAGSTLQYQWVECDAYGTEKSGSEYSQTAASDIATFDIPDTLPGGEYYFFCKLTASDSRDAEAKKSAPVRVTVYDITGVPEIGIAKTPITLGGTVLPAESGKSITWSIKDGADNNTAGAYLKYDNTVIEATKAGQVVLTATIDNNPAFTKEFTIEFLDITLTPNIRYVNRTFTMGSRVTLNTRDVTEDCSDFSWCITTGGYSGIEDGFVNGPITVTAPYSANVTASITYKGVQYLKFIPIGFKYPQTINRGTLAKDEFDLLQGGTDRVAWGEDTPATISADASNSGKDSTLQYQWVAHGADKSGSAYSQTAASGTSTFDIPATLPVGTHYFFCKLTASDPLDAEAKNSDIVTVRVHDVELLTNAGKPYGRVGEDFVLSGKDLCDGSNSITWAIKAENNTADASFDTTPGADPYTLQATTAGAVTVTATIGDTGVTKDFTITFPDITDVPESGIAGDALSLGGTVSPADPAQTISWEITDAGTTGAYFTDETNTAITATQAGQVVLTATIGDTGVTKDFTITFTEPSITFNPNSYTPDTKAASVIANKTYSDGELPLGQLQVMPDFVGAGARSYQWYKCSGTDPEAQDFTKEQVGGATTDNTFTIPTNVAAGTYYYYCVVTMDYPTPVTGQSEVFTVAVYDISIAPGIYPIRSIVSLDGSISPAGSGKSLTWSIKAGDDNNTARVWMDNSDTKTSIQAMKTGQVVMVATIDNNPALTKEFTIEFFEFTLTSKIGYVNRDFTLDGKITLNTTDVSDDCTIVWEVINTECPGIENGLVNGSGPLKATAPGTITVTATFEYQGVCKIILYIPFSYPQTINGGALAENEIELMKGDANAITWSTPATISADASGSGMGSTLQYQWVECDADGTEKAESSYSQTAASGTPAFDLATLPAGEYHFFCKLTASDPLDAEAKKSEPVHVTVYDITGVRTIDLAGARPLGGTVLPAESGKSITWSIKEGAGNNTAGAVLYRDDTAIQTEKAGQVVMVATIDNNPALTKEFTMEVLEVTLDAGYVNRSFTLEGTVTLNTTDVTMECDIFLPLLDTGSTGIYADSPDTYKATAPGTIIINASITYNN